MLKPSSGSGKIGTNRRDEGVAIAKGPTGVYITGNTAGIFPGQTALPNDVDAFVSRYDEQGATLRAI
jgi:hypothetical protein